MRSLDGATMSTATSSPSGREREVCEVERSISASANRRPKGQGFVQPDARPSPSSTEAAEEDGRSAVDTSHATPDGIHISLCIDWPVQSDVLSPA